ncbi:homeobox domain-containing protein [Ordospora pajunii]|uniref:homeobox domain-containing protein n=1 Tax=Ordospora pajunii TaxID=3039483 RepID=UPI0029526C30|nr:homeobox domain-containing protein [Ordospora pajunii]KAH9411866.1 homeobox domain-containing protein [Ordospora pajunii]
MHISFNAKLKTYTKIKLSRAQRIFLNNQFDINPNPNAQQRALIADKSMISEQKVRNWFQNRRAKQKDDLKAAPCLAFHTVDLATPLPISIHPTSNDLYLRR